MLPTGGAAVGGGGTVAVGWTAGVGVGGKGEGTAVLVGEAWAMVGVGVMVGVGDALGAVDDGSAVWPVGGCGADGAGWHDSATRRRANAHGGRLVDRRGANQSSTGGN